MNNACLLNWTQKISIIFKKTKFVSYYLKHVCGSPTMCRQLHLSK